MHISPLPRLHLFLKSLSSFTLLMLLVPTTVFLALVSLSYATSTSLYSPTLVQPTWPTSESSFYPNQSLVLSTSMKIALILYSARRLILSSFSRMKRVRAINKFSNKLQTNCKEKLSSQSRLPPTAFSRSSQTTSESMRSPPQLSV